MLLRKPTRIELKPEDKEVPNCLNSQLPCSDADEHLPNLQYENVKKAQAEAQARQKAEAGQQTKFDQQQQASMFGKPRHVRGVED